MLLVPGKRRGCRKRNNSFILNDANAADFRRGIMHGTDNDKYSWNNTIYNREFSFQRGQIRYFIFSMQRKI
jgi:hypothetical protein